MPVNPLNADVRERESRFKYPSPFFDIASTYVPPSIKSLFRFTRYFYYSNPIISPIIYKLSEYPITNLIYEKGQGEAELDDKAKDLWKRLLEENLKIKRLQIEINLDFNIYGNAFLSIYYPFIRMLQCPSCKKKHNINRVEWKWTNWKFKGICPDCKTNVQEFKVVDKTIKNRKKIKIVRWNPSNISIDYNAITGESIYTYGIPNSEKKAIKLGRRGHIDTVPWVFVEAVKGNKNIELENENLFHFKRASVSDSDMGWGMPVIFPVIKTAYYLQVLRKAQESVAVGHIVPLRILFPQQNADTTPYVTMNLGQWKKQVEQEIHKTFADLADQVTGDIRTFSTLLYMLIGTSLAMGTFGALLGKKNMKLLNEERRMSDTHKLFIQKEEQFEQRLFNLQNRMRGITKVSASIQRSADLKAVFRLCADGIHDVLNFDRVNIFLVNRKTGMLECQETRGNLNEAIEDIQVPLNEAGGVLNLTIKNDRPYVVRGSEEMKPEYILQHPYDLIKAIRSVSFMLIPFHDGHEPVGLFAVDNKFKKTAIHDEEVDIIRVLADQTSVAISNIRLIQGIRRMDYLMSQAFKTIKDRRERYAQETQKLALATTSFRKSADTMTMDAEEMLTASDQEMKVAEDLDRKSTRLNSSHIPLSRMPSSA